MEAKIGPELPAALSAMLSDAAAHSPYYRDQEWAKRLRSGLMIDFHEIPITGKRLVREDAERFFSSHVAPSEGKVIARHTSGSTGEPILIRKTQRHFQINVAENRRLMQGWDLASHRRVAEIEFPDEDHPVGKLERQSLKNGAEKWKLATLDGPAAFDLFRRTSATLALAFPSIMQAALQQLAESAQPLSLRLVWTVSEVVSDELRRLVGQIPGCRLVDAYGCVEAGLIAAQCPLCDAYHPADRHLVLELVGEDGRPAGPGQMGRVVVTPLFNRAMPLIRYETGDYAVAGEASGCPRLARAIRRVIGREFGSVQVAGWNESGRNASRRCVAASGRAAIQAVPDRLLRRGTALCAQGRRGRNRGGRGPGCRRQIPLPAFPDPLPARERDTASAQRQIPDARMPDLIRGDA